MQASKESEVKRALLAREAREDGQSHPVPVFSPDADEKGGPDAEGSYVRIKRSDLEKVLALVERIERRIG